MRRAKKYNLTIIVFFLMLSVLAGRKVCAENSAQEIFLIAQKAFDDGFYDVAIRYINQLTQDYPQTDKIIQANLILGQCYYFKHQYLKAFDIFQNLLKYPEFKDATLFWLGETYLKGSDYQNAENNYRQLIDIYPDSIYTPQAYYSLGWVYYEQSLFSKAKDTFQTLLKRFPTHQLAEDASFKLGESEYSAHNYKSTIEYFRNFIKGFEQATRHAEAYFYIGESYYYLEDYPNAIDYYAKAEQISKDNKLSLMSNLSLGWANLKLKNFSQAEIYFKKAMEFAQEKAIVSDDVFLGLANLYSETGKYKEALDAYTQLIENFPSSKRIAEAYLGKANTYYLLKNYEKAIETYESITYEIANDLTKQDILEKAYFGLAWANLKAGKIDASIKIFETIKDKTESKTVKISALTQIGDAYQDAEKLDKAIEIYDKILNEYQNSPYMDYVQYRQAIALLKQGKLESAALSFRTLESNFPQSNYLNDIKYYLAIAYFKKEDWANTIDQIQKFIIKTGSDNDLMAEAHYILGLSYFNLHDYAASLKTFEQTVKNYPLQLTIVRNANLYIAKCYFKVDDPKEAIKKFQQIILKYPDNDVAQDALIWLGDYNNNLSQFEEAISYYEQFIKQFPGSNKINLVKFELGRIYQFKNELHKAIELYKGIDSANGRELMAKAQLAIAEVFSKDLDPQSAIQNYRNIIQTSPEFARDAYIEIAEVLKSGSQEAKAIEEYRSALKMEQKFSKITNAELQFYIGDALEQTNETEKAIEEYLKIPYLYAKEDAWITKAYLRIARIFEDKDKWEEAKTTYKKVIDLNVVESKFAQERIDWILSNITQRQ